MQCDANINTTTEMAQTTSALLRATAVQHACIFQKQQRVKVLFSQEYALVNTKLIQSGNIPHICHGRHGHVRVNFFWPV